MSLIPFSQFTEKYVFECQLTEGSFGKICRIREKSTYKSFALKKVSARKKQQI